MSSTISLDYLAEKSALLAIQSDKKQNIIKYVNAAVVKERGYHILNQWAVKAGMATDIMSQRNKSMQNATNPEKKNNY